MGGESFDFRAVYGSYFVRYPIFHLNVRLMGCWHDSFVSSVGSATFFLTITGFSWAVTQWAPFSLVRPKYLLLYACQTNNNFPPIALRSDLIRPWEHSGFRRSELDTGDGYQDLV
jgi:hypothetical protein